MVSINLKRLAVFAALAGGLAGAARGAPYRPGAPGNFGAGVVVGDPTGLTAKWWTGDNRAIDIALAWDLSGADKRVEAHADYLWHFPLEVQGMEGRLPLYV